MVVLDHNYTEKYAFKTLLGQYLAYSEDNFYISDSYWVLRKLFPLWYVIDEHKELGLVTLSGVIVLLEEVVKSVSNSSIEADL